MDTENKRWKQFKKALEDNIEKAKDRNKVDSSTLEIMKHLLSNTRIRNKEEQKA